MLRSTVHIICQLRFQQIRMKFRFGNPGMLQWDTSPKGFGFIYVVWLIKSDKWINKQQRCFCRPFLMSVPLECTSARLDRFYCTVCQRVYPLIPRSSPTRCWGSCWPSSPPTSAPPGRPGSSRPSSGSWWPARWRYEGETGSCFNHDDDEDDDDDALIEETMSKPWIYARSILLCSASWKVI